MFLFSFFERTDRNFYKLVHGERTHEPSYSYSSLTLTVAEVDFRTWHRNKHGKSSLSIISCKYACMARKFMHTVCENKRHIALTVTLQRSKLAVFCDYLSPGQLHLRRAWGWARAWGSAQPRAQAHLHSNVVREWTTYDPPCVIIGRLFLLLGSWNLQLNSTFLK